jgi:hypothetical protein
MVFSLSVGKGKRAASPARVRDRARKRQTRFRVVEWNDGLACDKRDPATSCRRRASGSQLESRMASVVNQLKEGDGKARRFPRAGSGFYRFFLVGHAVVDQILILGSSGSKVKDRGGSRPLDVAILQCCSSVICITTAAKVDKNA